MKIILLDPRLHFVSIGRGKMHAADSISEQKPLFTMWGRDIPTQTEPQVTRQYSTSNPFCGRCYASLRTYESRFVRHASPPCQEYSRSRHIRDATVQDVQHKPQLIQAVRTRLEQSGLPWVIENVEDAPLPDALELCGSMFGLNTRRHRWFSSSILLFAPGPCQHTTGFVNPVGGKVRGYGVLRHPTRTYLDKSGRTRRAESSMTRAAGCKALDIDWMTIAELSQAIPPAYTHWIGWQLIEYLKSGSEVEVA